MIGYYVKQPYEIRLECFRISLDKLLLDGDSFLGLDQGVVVSTDCSES